MKRNFVLIALALALFVLAAGCDNKDTESPTTPAPQPADKGDQSPPPATPGSDQPETPDDAPPAGSGDSAGLGDIDSGKLPGEIKVPPVDTEPDKPDEADETPEELKIKSNPSLDRSLDALKLLQKAPECGRIYRLFLVNLYDGRPDELYAMLDAESRKNFAADLASNAPYFEDDAKFETELKASYESRIKIAQKRADNETDVTKKHEKRSFANALASDLKMYENLKAAYTKEMTPAEYYLIVARHRSEDLTLFFEPRLNPVITETKVDDTHYVIAVERNYLGKMTRREINFALEDGEWKIADPFE